MCVVGCWVVWFGLVVQFYEIMCEIMCGFDGVRK